MCMYGQAVKWVDLKAIQDNLKIQYNPARHGTERPSTAQHTTTRSDIYESNKIQYQILHRRSMYGK